MRAGVLLSILLCGFQQDPRETCRKLTGCHKSHEKQKIDCPSCGKNSIPANDAVCSRCATKDALCRHCGKPRRARTKPAKARAEKPIPFIRVLLRPGSSTESIECDGPVDITAPGARKPVRSVASLPPAEITLTGTGFKIADLDLNADTLLVVCLNPEAPIKLGKRRYAGTLRFVKKKDKFQVVSEVTLEQYLLGVVGPEIGYGSPFEAMKAQAVAARSYAWSGVDGKKHRPVYDVFDDTRSQVYIGVPDRDYKTVRKAVQETRGWFLILNKKVLRSEFSSACGGSTKKMGGISGKKCGYCRRKKYGHGRGLCQWGAMNMAKDHPDRTWKDILDFYYEEAELQNRY